MTVDHGPSPVDLGVLAREVLESAWSPEHECCRPNPQTYPHRWLWDSCFHAIAWGAIGDERGVRELRTTLAARFESGFVPHMAYHEPTIRRGPREDASSLTQPPVFCHAAALLKRGGFALDEALVEGCRAGLQALWDLRMDNQGMLVIVHPWEAGWDDSPRWDGWAGRRDWERPHWTQVDLDLVDALHFDAEGVARNSDAFVVASAGFNAIAAHAAIALAGIAFDPTWASMARDLADAIDRVCWDEDLGFWVDNVHVGDGSGRATPTLDGLLPALVTTDAVKGRRALSILRERFVRPHGVAYVATDDPVHNGDQYWRGTAWAPLDHYAWLIAERWEDQELCDQIAAAARRGAIVSGMAEHRNPVTGAGHGAVPQTLDRRCGLVPEGCDVTPPDAAAVRQAAVDLLDRASRPIGFVASVADAHYDAVWTRDAAITCLGALTDTQRRWDDVVVRTLSTVAAKASPVGQLPNTVWADGWWDFGEHAAVDPTLWWALAALAAVEREVPGAARLEPTLTAAFTWLRHLDAGGTGLVQQPVASDWMDSSLQRVGVTLHANALFAWALRRAEALDVPTGPGPDGDEVAARLDALLWPRPGGDPAQALGFLPAEVRARGLPHPATVAAHRGGARADRRHWASHLRWGHLVDVVDVLGNALAVLAGVGTADQHGAVLAHLDDLAVDSPHPSRTLDRPCRPGDRDGMLDVAADDNQDPRWRNPAWEYHNAASWPMVGGFHAWALRRHGRNDRADEVAAGLVGASVEAGTITFPEWRHGQTGAAGGARDQVWSAAGYLLAHDAG